MRNEKRNQKQNNERNRDRNRKPGAPRSRRLFDVSWATVKHRKGGFVAAFVALFCGSAVVTACGILLMSGLVSCVEPERYAGATVMVGGRQSLPVKEDFDPFHAERAPLPAATADRVAEVPGVKSVVPERTVGMTLTDDRGAAVPLGRPLYGHGWSSAALAPFRLTEGHAPGGDRDAVLDVDLARGAGLGVGDTARLTVGTTSTSYRITGLVSAPRIERQSAVFVTDARAGQLAPRPDRVTAIGVFGDPGTDPDELAARIGRAVPDTAVYTGRDVGDLEFLDVGQSRGFLVGLSASFGGTALAVVIFVVSSTLGLAIHQRRRELAMLRAVAATPRQIHRLIGGEILLVGTAGALLGAVPGFLVADGLRAAFARAGVLPADFELSSHPLPALASVLLCVAGARLAGYIAAFRVARIRPVEALSESQAEPRGLGRTRRSFGWVLILLGVGSAVAVPLLVPGQLALAGAGGSLLLLMVGFGLIGPLAVKLAARAMGPFLRRSRVSGYLAAANSTANARRLSAAVVPLALAAAMALMQLSILSTVEAEAKRQAASGVVADHVLTGDGTGLSPELAAAVRKIPGVDTVTPVARSRVMLHYKEIDQYRTEPFSAQGVDPARLDRTLDLDVRDGGLGELRGDTVALSWTAAGTARLGVGDTTDVYLGDGVRKKLRVVAVYGNGLGFGDVTVPHDLMTRHTTSGLDSALLVTATGTGDDARVTTALDRLARDTPTLTVRGSDDFAAAQEADITQQSWTNLIANAVLLLYVLIAVVNTLVMATTGRGREFAMLRLIGTSTRQTRRMMSMESGVVIVTAVVVGVLIALPPAVGASLATTGRAVPHVEPLVWAGVAVFVAVLGRLSISVPTRAALRARPVDAVSTGE
ncbi:ABC transporter permease [Streptomyces sp. NPDC058001]|uniref:ABC transporter permease n=1 Tax=Streptomyces sp. NPDC058001 TaxID=3346300 RepID=UPI0036EEE1E9